MRLPARLAPVGAATALALLYLVLEPRTVDMAAHEFRAGLFDREGFAIWNGHWYGGHHAVAYSVLFPPLAWLVGPEAVGAASAVAAAALFEPLARRHFGRRARWGALWFGLGTATMLFTGRLPFALGVAIGLAGLLALQRNRRLVAAGLAVACALASPVAALFLVLAGTAHALAREARGGLLLAAAALAPILMLAAAFPEGGTHPFSLSAFLPVPLFALVFLALLPGRERALRWGAGLYALAAVAAFAIDTPVGANAGRLGALFGGPLAACALLGREGASRLPHRVLAVLLVALAGWQWSPAVRDLRRALSDPAVEAAYYAPLLGFLERSDAQTGRVEVVFTKSHWEAAEVAPRFPLARGWQRQLDVGRNTLFYENALTDATYAAWLRDLGVRFVALADSELDDSASAEGALVEREPPYLRPRWRSAHWRVYEVTGSPGLVTPASGGQASLAYARSDELGLRFQAAGTALARVRWTPYWRAEPGCVERDGEWTRVTAPRPGLVRLTIGFSLDRVLSRGRRCSSSPLGG